MSVTCEKTHVKTFHETQRHEMHLLRGAGASRSKRRVDIASSLKFHFDSWLEFSMTFLLSLFLLFHSHSVFLSFSRLMFDEMWRNANTFRYITPPSIYSTSGIREKLTLERRRRKSPRTLLNVRRVFCPFFPFQIVTHWLSHRLLYGKQRWCDDTKLPNPKLVSAIASERRTIKNYENHVSFASSPSANRKKSSRTHVVIVEMFLWKNENWIFGLGNTARCAIVCLTLNVQFEHFTIKLSSRADNNFH